MKELRKPISARRLTFYAALFFAVLTSGTLLAVGKDGPEIQKVRVGQHAESTRVVLESNIPLEPKIFTLRNPNRVVLDFPEIGFSRSLSDVDQPPKSLVTKMREGLFKPGVTRMVLDVRYPVAVKTFTIGESNGFGYRIVLDLSPVTQVSFDSLTPPEEVVADGGEAGEGSDQSDNITAPAAVAADTIAAMIAVSTSGPADTIEPTSSGASSSKPVPSLKAAKPKTKQPEFVPLAEQPALKLPALQATPKKKGDPIVVMIDPGHGGVDPGAVTRSKIYEKHIVLSVAKRLRDELNKTPGYKAYLTRDKDIYIPLGDRVKKAQDVHADIFVSIHADAHRNRKVNGGSVYVLSEKSSDKEAARLAAHANSGDIIAGLDLSEEVPEVRDILIDLTQRETLNKSTMLAQDVIKKLSPMVTLRKKEPLYAGFRVLKAPEIPSILVELAYLSNPQDEQRLRNSSQQQKMAKALAGGIQAFARKNVHR